MGANLIGYLLKGPVKIDESKKLEAIEFANKNSQKARKLIESIQKLDGKLEENTNLYKELSKMLDVDFIYDNEDDVDFIYDNEDAESELDVLVFQDDDSSKSIEQIIGLWESPGARDCFSRLDPNDYSKQLLFVGEMGWGDEPQGYGYQTINMAMKLNVLEILDIN